MKATIVVILVCFFFVSNANARISWTSNVKGPKGELPAVPAAKGYGVYTRPAKNAKVIKVTNVKESGAGSLEACIEASGPRVCVFEVAGRIKYRGNFDIRKGDLHIAGQTAPNPGIVVQAPRSVIRASNVVIEHMRFMSTDELTNRNIRDSSGYNRRDALVIEGGKSIFLNHVTVNFGVDGNLDIAGRTDNITIRNSLVGMMLNFSIHANGNWRGLGAHSFNMLISHQVGNVDITRSVLAYAQGRLPRSGARNLFYSENVNYHTNRNFFVDLYTRAGGKNNRTVNANVVGNVFITDRSNTSIVNTYADKGGKVNVYSAKNDLILERGRSIRSPSGAASTIRRTKGGSAKVLTRAVSMPHKQSIPRSPVREKDVLNLAGARPAARIPLEREIVRNISARKGEVVNCYHETGDRKFNTVLQKYAKYKDRNAPSIKDRCELDKKGWNGWRQWLLATKVVSKRSLNGRLPRTSDLNRTLPSGYTHLEAFLHACSRKVEQNSGDCHSRNIDRSGRGWR